MDGPQPATDTAATEGRLVWHADVPTGPPGGWWAERGPAATRAKAHGRAAASHQHRGHGGPPPPRNRPANRAAGRMVGGKGPGGHASKGPWTGRSQPPTPRPRRAAPTAQPARQQGRREDGGRKGARRPHERRPMDGPQPATNTAATEGRPHRATGPPTGPPGG